MPVAFLLRFGLARGFLRLDGAALAAAGALLLSYIVATTQVGLAASLIVGLLVVRRVLAAARKPLISPYRLIAATHTAIPADSSVAPR